MSFALLGRAHPVGPPPHGNDRSPPSVSSTTSTWRSSSRRSPIRIYFAVDLPRRNRCSASSTASARYSSQQEVLFLFSTPTTFVDCSRVACLYWVHRTYVTRETGNLKVRELLMRYAWVLLSSTRSSCQVTNATGTARQASTCTATQKTQ